MSVGGWLAFLTSSWIEIRKITSPTLQLKEQQHETNHPISDRFSITFHTTYHPRRGYPTERYRQ